MTQRALEHIRQFILEYALPYSIHHPNDPVARADDEDCGPDRPQMSPISTDFRRETSVPSFV
jgi:hypothetical protein